MNANWKKTFAVLYSGQALSIIASTAVQFSVLLYLAGMKSPIVLAIAGIAGFLPAALIGPFAGVWVDRLNRKLVMILSDIYVAITASLLAFVAYLGTPPLEFIYLILFLRATGAAFRTPALQASIPLIVPEGMLTKVGGISQLTQSLGLMLGPVLGSLLLVWFGLAGVLLLDVVGALIAVITILLVKIPKVDISKTVKKHVLKELYQGYCEIKRNKPLFMISLPMIIAVIVYVPISSLFQLMVKIHFNGGDMQIAYVQVAFAIGLLISSGIMALFGKAKRRFMMISFSLSMLGVFLTISGILPSNAFIVFAILMGLLGICGNFFMIPYQAYVQLTIPPQSLGRVFSLIFSAMSFASPVGLVVAGPLAEILGIQTWFWISGLLVTIVGVIAMVTTRKFDLEPASDNMSA